MLRRRAVVYTTVIALSVGAIAAILQLGETWFATGGATTTVADAAHSSDARGPLAVLIVQLLVIILATQFIGGLAGLIRQPAVIGEIAAGLLLGPSLLGQVWP